MGYGTVTKSTLVKTLISLWGHHNLVHNFKLNARQIGTDTEMKLFTIAYPMKEYESYIYKFYEALPHILLYVNKQ